MPENISPALDDDAIDPEIRQFVATIAAGYAESDGTGAADFVTRREIAERIREPWRAGGPTMAKTLDLAMNGTRLRVHLPAAEQRLPAMLYIHGGGWVLFSIDTHDRLMREYAARAGIAVIGIDYSLAPESKFPVALDECAAALDWIAEQADVLNVDRDRILIGGDSAGANLSVAACLLQKRRGRPLPSGMLLNYGAFSPAHLPSYARYGDSRYPLAPDEMDAFWADYVDSGDQLDDPLVVPLNADLAGMPPAFIAIAECDILADCNHEFAKRLAEAGVPVCARTYRGATHSFLEAVSISALAKRAFEEQAAWIREIAGHDGAL